MIEEFDAIQRLDLSGILLYATGLLLIGILLEVGLRYGKRWTLSKDYTWIPAVLGALTWQPLFWAALVGIVLPLLAIVEDTSEWQRGNDLIWTLVLLAITVVIVRLINGLLKILTATMPSASASLLTKITNGVGISVVVAIILGYIFNISFVILLVAIAGGITGLSVVFQDTLNNLVSGVSLTISNRLAPGDWVRLPSGTEGQVIDIQWDVVVLKQLANNFIVVPNKSMTNSDLINFDRPSAWLSALVAVGVHYNSDLEQVERIALEEARQIMGEINGDLPTPDPVIRYNTFADSSINFNVVLWAGTYSNQYPLKHEFIKRLHRRFKVEGIVIPFPIRTLEFPANLSPGLVAPAPAAGDPPPPSSEKEEV